MYLAVFRDYMSADTDAMTAGQSNIAVFHLILVGVIGVINEFIYTLVNYFFITNDFTRHNSLFIYRGIRTLRSEIRHMRSRCTYAV